MWHLSVDKGQSYIRGSNLLIRTTTRITTTTATTRVATSMHSHEFCAIHFIARCSSSFGCHLLCDNELHFDPQCWRCLGMCCEVLWRSLIIWMWFAKVHCTAGYHCKCCKYSNKLCNSRASYFLAMSLARKLTKLSSKAFNKLSQWKLCCTFIQDFASLSPKLMDIISLEKKGVV